MNGATAGEQPSGALWGERQGARALAARTEAHPFLDRAVSQVRWAILAGTFLITLVWPVPGRPGLPSWLFVLLFAAYNLLAELLRRRVPRLRRGYGLPALDLLAAGALYAFAPEPAGPLFALFTVAVVAAALRLPLRGALLYTGAALAVATLLAPTLPNWSPTAMTLQQFASRLLVLALVGLGGALLARGLGLEQEATRAAREINEQLLLAALREQEAALAARDRAEGLAARLRQQLDFQRAIDESVAEGLYAVDREGRATFVNPAAEQLLGWARAELLGQVMHDAIHYRRPDGRPYPKEECPGLRVLQTGTPYRTDEEAFIRRDGTLFPVAYSAAPIFGADGRAEGVVVAFADITARKRAEEELRTRARQQAAVAELGQRALATPDLEAVLSEGATTVARTLDVRFAKVLELLPGGHSVLLRAGVGWREGLVGRASEGVERDSQAGYTLLSSGPVIVEDLRAETRFTFPPMMHEHGVVSTMSVAIPSRDRPYGVLQADSTRPRRFSPDDVHFLQAVANVLGTTIQRRAAEEQLAEERAATEAERTRAARLEELDRLRNDFVASVSHDLRSPLSAARLAAGALAGGLSGQIESHQGQYVDILRRSLDRLGLYIDNLLTVNELDAGALQLRRQALNLRAVVLDAVEVVRPLLEEKGQELALDLPEPLPVEGDARQLERVLVNLLANAHTHTPEGTRIAVAGRRTAETVELVVSDDGPGIPAEELERIFERHHRLDTGRPGSGLGLAIVQGLVEAHGGRVWAEGTPGGGATFRVALPRGAPAPGEEAAREVADGARGRG